MVHVNNIADLSPAYKHGFRLGLVFPIMGYRSSTIRTQVFGPEPMLG